MCLDQKLPVALEGGAHTDADRCGMIECESRIDADRRHDHILDRCQVCGGHAERATASVSFHHSPLELEWSAQELPRTNDVPLLQQRPDPARRHGLAVHLQERDDRRLELGAALEQSGITASIAAEAEVRAHADVSSLERPDQNVVAELLGSKLRELLRERNHDQLVDARLSNEVCLHRWRRQQSRRVIGTENLERMGIERHDGDGRPVCPPPPEGALDHAAVPEVNAVEGADCQRPPGRSRRDVGQVLDHLHQEERTATGLRRSSRHSATAISSPSATRRTTSAG